VDEWELVPVEWCDWYTGNGMTSPDQVYTAIAAAQYSWDAVLCWNELQVELACDIADRLGVAAARFSPQLFRNKALMHERLQQEGIPSAFVGSASSPARCRELVREAGLPAVIKPADFGGSDGVRLVRGEDEIAKAYRQAVCRAPSRRVVVDRFVPGPEVSVECVTTLDGIHHVLAVTEKLVSDPPFFLELGHLIPAALPSGTQVLVESLARRSLTALGMRCGVSHTELKLGPEGPVVIESAARQAGDMIPKLVHLATGSNPYLLELEAIQQMDASLNLADEGSTTCIRFFGLAEARPVVHPPVEEALAGSEHLLVELSYWYPEGAKPPRHRGNGSRFGYCMLSGVASEVRAACARLERL